VHYLTDDLLLLWLLCVWVCGDPALGGCSKSSLLAAKAELFQQAKDVKADALNSAEGMKQKGQVVRDLEGVRRMTAGADTAIKTAKSITSTVYRKTSSTVNQMSEPEITVDVELEAGFDLVHHYSRQFSRLHVHSTKNAAAAKRAAEMITVHTNDTKLLQSRFTSVQAELTALPNVMTQLSQQVETIYKLRDGLHELEAQLGDLETLCDKVDVRRADLAARRKRAEYQRHANTALYIQQSDFATKVRGEHAERNKPLASRLKESMLQFAGEVLEQRAKTSSPAPGDGAGEAASGGGGEEGEEGAGAAEVAAGKEAEAAVAAPAAPSEAEAEANVEDEVEAVAEAEEAEATQDGETEAEQLATAAATAADRDAADKDATAASPDQTTPADASEDADGGNNNSGSNEKQKKKKKKK
jgi:hypothetical protein